MLDLENNIKQLKSTWIRRIFSITINSGTPCYKIDIELFLCTVTEYLVYLKENIKNDFGERLLFKEI